MQAIRKADLIQSKAAQMAEVAAEAKLLHYKMMKILKASYKKNPAIKKDVIHADKLLTEHEDFIKKIIKKP